MYDQSQARLGVHVIALKLFKSSHDRNDRIQHQWYRIHWERTLHVTFCVSSAYVLKRDMECGCGVCYWDNCLSYPVFHML